MSHTFAEPGSYLVRITVEDVAGLMGYDSVMVVVESGEEKLPPWARIVVNNNDHDTPAEVTYAIDAEDPDGVIVAYRWTFHDGETSTEPLVIKSYDEAGTYDVQLEVEDNDGLLGYDHQSVYVRVDAKVPPRIVSAPNTTARVGEPYQYDLDGRAAAQGTRPIAWEIGRKVNDETVGDVAGLGVGGLSGVVTWTPRADQVGQHRVVLTATNSVGIDSQQFLVVVSGDETPPPRKDSRRSGCGCSSSSTSVSLWLLLLAVWGCAWRPRPGRGIRASR